MIFVARLRTTIFETDVRILGRTSKSTNFQDFRYERSGNDQKQNDGNLTKVTKNVLTEKYELKVQFKLLKVKGEFYGIITSFYYV